MILGAPSALLSEYGAMSTISDSVGLMGSSWQCRTQLHWRLQANIWLELAKMFLEVDKLTEVQQQCVEEASTAFLGSHQTVYLKGRLALEWAKLTDGQGQGQARFLAEAKGSFLGVLAIFFEPRVVAEAAG